MNVNEQQAAAELEAAALITQWLLRSSAKQHQGAIWRHLSARADTGPGYALPLATVLLPRQCSKTTSIYALLLARTALRKRYAAAYTAQKGTVVTHVMSNPDNGWLTAVDTVPQLAARWRSAHSQGRELIAHRTNTGAYVKAFPPTPGRLRSNALDCVVMDECQEHSHQLGSQLLADTGPVFTTRPRRQLVLMGTAGDSGSWWHIQCERARASGSLLEIGSWPDDADPADPAVWAAHHPGLRSGMTDQQHLAAQLDVLGADLFAREYGNRWTGGASDASAAIPDRLWLPALEGIHPGSAPDLLTVDISPDSASACIVAIASTAGGTVAGIVNHEAGTSWLPDRLRELRATHPALPIYLDARGPAAALADRAQRDGLRLHESDAHTQRGAMHSHFMAELENGTAKAIPHPALEAARAAAVRSWDDSGLWRWNRRKALGDISPLVAWTLAVWHARKKTNVKPQIAT